MIGYGSQGHGQSLNARDNGLKVIVGVRKGGESWKQAQEDGWVEGETLFSIEEAIGKGTIIMNLLSDAAQSQTWNEIKPLITKDKTLYFAHGFSVVFKEDVSRALALASASASTDPRSYTQKLMIRVHPALPLCRPASFPPRTSTSSSSPPRDPAEPSDPSSSRDEESTRPSPSSRTLPARPRRRPSPSESPSDPGEQTFLAAGCLLPRAKGCWADLEIVSLLFSRSRYCYETTFEKE